MANLIKAAGYKTKRIDTDNYGGLFGGTCNHVIGLFNDKEEILHFEGKPYFPCGRRSAFTSLIENDSIAAPCFFFKKIDAPADYSITFGEGEDAVTVLEPACKNQKEMYERLSITGWEVENITSIHLS